MEEQQNKIVVTLKQFFYAFIIKIAVGIAIGLLVGYSVFSSKEFQGNSPNTEQDKTDEVLALVARNDSLVLLYAQEAMYYRELHLNVKAKFDSLHLNVNNRANRIDSLVHSDFETLPDSTKLLYRERVIARLSE